MVMIQDLIKQYVRVGMADTFRFEKQIQFLNTYYY